LKKIKDSWAPLSASFMLTSILGFLISVWFISDLSRTWGFTLTFFFVIMFLASIISMTKAEPIPEHMDHLAIHEPHKAYKPFTRSIKSEKFDEKLIFLEPFLFVFGIIWLYYAFHQIRGTVFDTNGYLAILFMSLALIFTIFFLIDLFSRESLYVWEQVIIALILIVTAGYGVFYFPLAGVGLAIYYIHKKASNK